MIKKTRRKILTGIAVLSLLALTAALRADWLTFQNDQNRSGYSSTAASGLSIPVPIGTVAISGPGANLSQPIKTRDYIYVGTHEGKVVRVNINTLKMAGYYQTGGPITATGMLQNGIIYIGSEDGYFYAIDSTNMALKWRLKASGGISASALYISDSSGNRIIFIDNNGLIFSIKINTDGSMSTVTTLNLNDNVASSPALGQNINIIASSGKVYTVNKTCTVSNAFTLTGASVIGHKDLPEFNLV